MSISAKGVLKGWWSAETTSLKTGLKKLECLKKILYLFLSAAVSGQVRTGSGTSGFPFPDLGPVPALAGCWALVWIKCSLSARIKHGTDGETPGGEGLLGLTLSTAPLPRVGMLPGSSPCLPWGLGSAPACASGKGMKRPCSPSPMAPAPRGTILPLFSSQVLDVLCADAKLLPQDPLIHPRGGLTPRLGFFSWVLIALVVLMGAGPPRGVPWWSLIPAVGWGAGYSWNPSLVCSGWGLEQ